MAYVTKRNERERTLPESGAVFDPIVTLEMARLQLHPAVMIEMPGVAQREGSVSTLAAMRGRWPGGLPR
jgi:hypothetical protein